MPTTPAIPRSVVLPPVTLPSGAAVYGTTQPGVSSVTFSIAPAGFRCAATLGADGSYFMDLTAPGSTAPSISYGYSSGGAGINASLACGYFPALQVPLSEGGFQCTPPLKGEIVRPVTVPSGINLLAATTTDAPGILPPKGDLATAVMSRSASSWLIAAVPSKPLAALCRRTNDNCASLASASSLIRASPGRLEW